MHFKFAQFKMNSSLSILNFSFQICLYFKIFSYCHNEILLAYIGFVTDEQGKIIKRFKFIGCANIHLKLIHFCGGLLVQILCSKIFADSFSVYSLH